MRRPWKIAAVIVFSASLLVGGLVGDRLLALSDETRESLRLYTELVNLAYGRYGTEISYEDLVYSSIQGMLRNLDPHTNFLSPEAYDTMRDRQQSSFYGLGILVGIRNGQLTVITPIPGTPADRLGMRAGDVISLIEGEPTETMTLDEAVHRLKGPKDTQVHITIVRRGMDAPLELDIHRAEIPQTTLQYAYMMTPDTAYIQIRDFSRSTGREMAAALESLKSQGMQRLLLDLRNNGGGLLDQAIEVAEQFVPEDSRIVETRGRTRSSHQTYVASGEHPVLELPLVVLVNDGTASAAEIVAGAIQDHDFGLVVGVPTWGKGLVQTVYGLSYGAGLALTTAKYYTPSGRLIQRDYSSYWDYYTQYDPTGGEAVPRDSRPAEEFLTDLGRKVYGGGGITPDVLVKAEEISTFLQYLISRSAFFRFAVDYQTRNPVSDRAWEPEPEMLEELKSWLLEEGLTEAEELQEAFANPDTAAYALDRVHFEILNTAFGLEAGHRVFSRQDNQLQSAFGLFDRAAALLAARRTLDSETPQRIAATEPAASP